MTAPTTPRFPDYDGQIVTVWVSLTATGGTKEMAVNLAAGDPKIDIREGHPVLNAVFISNETDTTGSEPFKPENEMARAISPDSTGEWSITDADTIAIYQTADQNGFVGITYKAYGIKLA